MLDICLCLCSEKEKKINCWCSTTRIGVTLYGQINEAETCYIYTHRSIPTRFSRAHEVANMFVIFARSFKCLGSSTINCDKNKNQWAVSV